LVVNYIYNSAEIREGRHGLANPVFKLILNNWQISGITSLTSGAPQVVGSPSPRATWASTPFRALARRR
jgi:hypothetical protein